LLFPLAKIKLARIDEEPRCAVRLCQMADTVAQQTLQEASQLAARPRFQKPASVHSGIIVSV
jgi:hypothetical protein